MDEDDREAISQAIDLHVRAGFYGVDKMVEMIDETVLEPGTVDQKWLRAEIDQALRAKKQEEASWPAETDCDRLDRMFEALNREGVIALQNAGYTQSDGFEDVSEVYHEAGQAESGFMGYCFYHEQDLERVVEGDDLWLAFGDIHGDDEKGEAIGRRIQQAAERAGFEVEWDGTMGKRIMLRGIHWQRRSPT